MYRSQLYRGRCVSCPRWRHVAGAAPAESTRRLDWVEATVERQTKSILYGRPTRGSNFFHRLTRHSWFLFTGWKFVSARFKTLKSLIDSHFVQRPFRTKTTSYKGDHFVQKHRSHVEQGFFVKSGTWIFTFTRQESFHTKTISFKNPRVNFLFDLV